MKGATMPMAPDEQVFWDRAILQVHQFYVGVILPRTTIEWKADVAARHANALLKARRHTQASEANR